MIGPLLEQAVTQARTTPSAEELAAAASHTAYLLGVLRQAGEQLGAPPPHQVLVGPAGPAGVVAPDSRPRRAAR